MPTQNPSNPFDQFTNLYSLSKTLRFELKPVGKTLENMRKNLRWDEKLQTFFADQEIEDAYQVLKPVFDKIHGEFITKSLENDEAKGISFAEYFNLYNKWNELKRKKASAQDKKQKEEIEKQVSEIYKEVKSKGEIQRLEDDIRKSFEKAFEEYGKIFKDKADVIMAYDEEDNSDKNEDANQVEEKDDKKKSFIKSLKAKFLLDYIEKYLDTDELFNDIKSREGNQITKEQIKIALGRFKGFSTYFGGFELNRLNYYITKEDKATSVASRIVSENLPKFCDNALDFAKRKVEYENALRFLKERNIDTKDNYNNQLYNIDARLFEIAYFNKCLSQKEIEGYNNKIGNANFIINLYNQQQAEKNKELRGFKTLYKQIGCGEKSEFIPKIKDSDELKKILSDVAIKGESFFCSILNEDGLINLILKLDNFQGVYWSDKALNTISSKYFANWDSLKELLKTAKVFKKEKDEIRIPRTIELSDLFEVLDESDVLFKETFKDNNEKKHDIVNGSDQNSIKLLKMIFVDVEANKKVFENKKDEVTQLIAENADLKKDKNTQIVKAFLDSILFSNQILKYFKVRENKIKGNPLNSKVSEPLDKILDTQNKTSHDLTVGVLTYSNPKRVCPESFLPCSSMYFRIIASSMPTVLTKYPSDQIASVPQ